MLKKTFPVFYKKMTKTEWVRYVSITLVLTNTEDRDIALKYKFSKTRIQIQTANSELVSTHCAGCNLLVVKTYLHIHLSPSMHMLSTHTRM